MRVAVALLLLLAPAVAVADTDSTTAEFHPVESEQLDPCTLAIVDPIVTPVRDIDLDAQRSACMRRDLFVRVLGHALIDTPGFHGVLGGDLALGGHLRIRTNHELFAQLRIVDYSFVQNAVNKVTNTGFGPLVLGAATSTWFGAAARAALAFELELPYTRDEMDTTHVSGSLTGLLTSQLRSTLFLHARLGALGMHAASMAGSMNRLAFRAGSDAVWHVKTRLALQAGADLSAGWSGFDYVLFRAGIHWRITSGDWRLRAGVGLPVFGSERTNAVLDLALVRGI